MAQKVSKAFLEQLIKTDSCGEISNGRIKGMVQQGNQWIVCKGIHWLKGGPKVMAMSVVPIELHTGPSYKVGEKPNAEYGPLYYEHCIVTFKGKRWVLTGPALQFEEDLTQAAPTAATQMDLI